MITSPSSLSTTITNLSVGAYVFRCTVTDNYGGSGHADVQVTVAAASTDPILYVGVSSDLYTESGWTVLAGSPFSNVATTSAPFAGNAVGISTVSTTNYAPFSSFYSAASTGETIDDGGGFLAPLRVQQGNFFTENAYDPGKPQIQVSNLPAGTYTVRMFGSLQASFAIGHAMETNTEFRVNTGSPVVINTAGNTSHAATFTGIVVPANGNLNLYFNPVTPNSDAHLGMLCYFIIDKTN